MNRTPPKQTRPQTPSQRLSSAVRDFFHIAHKDPKTGETEILVTPAHLIAAAVALILLVLIVVFTVKACTAEPNWTYKIGSNKKTTVSESLAKPDKEVYIDLDAIAKLAGLTMTETVDEPRFNAPDGTYFQLKKDSANININGQSVKMTSPLVIHNETYWMPLNALGMILKGVTFECNEEKRTVTVTRNEDVAVTISVSAQQPSGGGEEDPPSPADALLASVQYTTDVSAYLPYIDPTDPTDYLLLVNPKHPITSSDVPADLTNLPASMSADGNTYQVRAIVVKALEALLAEMKAEGITDIGVTSAYRSYSYQSGLFNTYVSQERAKDPSLTQAAAEALVATYSCRPGTSEHQTGLCVDFTTNSIGGAVDDRFAQTPAAKWLAENAWKFGFILRFPADKFDLTGIKYEAWHFRFVGRATAAEIFTAGQCLEEYLAV